VQTKKREGELQVWGGPRGGCPGGKFNWVLLENTPCSYLLTPFFGNLMKEQELNTLKQKSPSDLWKEDLAVFIEELEVCIL
jgi:hypothetical protein